MSNAEFSEMQAIVAEGTLVLTPTMFAAVKAEYERRGLEMPTTLIEQRLLPSK